MEFNYKLFVQKFLNNELDQFQDQQIIDDDINNILQEIKNIRKNEFNLEKSINKIIIDTSKYLPYISLEFCIIYYNNNEIVYQALSNIYTYHRKYFPNLLSSIANIYYNKMIFNKYINIKFHLNYINIKILYTIYKWHIIFLYLIRNMYKTNSYILGFQILFLLYKTEIHNKFSQKEKSRLLNLIIKYIIKIFNNNEIIHLYEVHNEKKYCLNFEYLDLIISNWNIIKDQYKNIIKEKSSQWINYWEKNNYYIDINQKNNYLKFIDIYF